MLVRFKFPIELRENPTTEFGTFPSASACESSGWMLPDVLEKALDSRSPWFGSMASVVETREPRLPAHCSGPLPVSTPFSGAPSKRMAAWSYMQAAVALSLYSPISNAEQPFISRNARQRAVWGKYSTPKYPLEGWRLVDDAAIGVALEI